MLLCLTNTQIKSFKSSAVSVQVCLTSPVAMVTNTNIIKVELRCCFVPQVDFLVKYISSVQSVIHLCYYNQMVKIFPSGHFQRDFKSHSREKKRLFFSLHTVK